MRHLPPSIPGVLPARYNRLMWHQLRSILLVDDNEQQRYAMARQLRMIGHQVTEAADGRSGLALARQSPNVILLDVNLPDMSGFEVCRLLKQDTQTQDIPVVLISASCEPAQVHSMRERVGAYGFLIQPVEPEQLQAVIAGVVARNRAA